MEPFHCSVLYLQVTHSPEGRDRSGWTPSRDGSIHGGSDGSGSYCSGGGVPDGGFAQWAMHHQQQSLLRRSASGLNVPQQQGGGGGTMQYSRRHARVSSTGSATGTAADPYDPRDVATIVGSLPISFGAAPSGLPTHLDWGVHALGCSGHTCTGVPMLVHSFTF